MLHYCCMRGSLRVLEYLLNKSVSISKIKFFVIDTKNPVDFLLYMLQSYGNRINVLINWYIFLELKSYGMKIGPADLLFTMLQCIIQIYNLLKSSGLIAKIILNCYKNYFQWVNDKNIYFLNYIYVQNIYKIPLIKLYKTITTSIDCHYQT